MQVALGEGDLDPFFLEAIPDGQEDGTSDVGNAIGGIVNPETQFKVNRVIPESTQETFRDRILEYTFMLQSGLLTNPDCLMRVGTVGDADGATQA